MLHNGNGMSFLFSVFTHVTKVLTFVAIRHVCVQTNAVKIMLWSKSWWFCAYLCVIYYLKIMEKEKRSYFLLKYIFLISYKSLFCHKKKSLMQICQTRNCHLKSNATRPLCHFALLSLIYWLISLVFLFCLRLVINRLHCKRIYCPKLVETPIKLTPVSNEVGHWSKAR